MVRWENRRCRECDEVFGCSFSSMTSICPNCREKERQEKLGPIRRDIEQATQLHGEVAILRLTIEALIEEMYPKFYRSHRDESVMPDSLLIRLGRKVRESLPHRDDTESSE